MASERMIVVDDIPLLTMGLILPSFQAAMKEEIVPGNVGCTEVKFRFDMTGKKNGEVAVVCETNRALNRPSTDSIRQLVRGFFVGWRAAMKTSEVNGIKPT